MDKKIGIIGCQSKHAEFFGSLFNVDQRFPGYRAAYIFGDDDPERLPYVLQTAEIDEICDDPEELIDKSDLVLVTYRLGKRHFAPAMACIEAGKPVFVDKPFTLTGDQAITIVQAGKENNVVVQGGSTLCFDPQIGHIADLSRRSSFGTIAYRVDMDSPFNGYRFYGSHLTDLCAAVFGTDATSVRSYQYDEKVNHLICYPNSTVILQSTPEFKLPQVVLNQDNTLTTFILSDDQCYFNGMKAFIDAVETRNMDERKMEQLVFSTRLLDAIMRSLASGDEIQLAGI